MSRIRQRVIRGIPALLILLLSGNVAWGQPPEIRAVVSPAPNAGRWNNTPVTVTFVCERVATCPQPVTVTEEGTHRVTGAAVDAQGQPVETSAVVQIDLAGPTISLSSPSAGTRTDAASVAIAASVSDAISGVAVAFCNGEPAHVSGGVSSCTRPLREGANVVIVSTLDAAGNSASAAMEIWREVAPRILQLSPNELTIGVAHPPRALQLIDESGRTLQTGVECQVRDSAVIQVVKTEDAPCALVGLAQGKTVVSAIWEGLSATMTVTVLDAQKPPLGTLMWTIPKTAGFEVKERVQLDAAGDNNLLVIEGSPSSGLFRVKALEKAPRLLFWQWPAVAPHDKILRWMGDTGGGGLLLVQSRGSARTAIVRVGRPAVGIEWRYESAGRLLDGWAMGWDGTLYIAEIQGDGFAHILGIDSATGRAKFRLPMPRPLRSSFERRCAPTASLLTATPVTLGPATVPDGERAAFAFIEELAADEGDQKGCGPSQAKRYALKLLRVDSDGRSTIRTLREVTSPGGAAHFALHVVVPDGRDANLVPVRTTLPDGSVDNRIVRVENASERVTQYTLPALGQYVLGAERAFMSDGRLLVAFDPVTGAVQWTSRSPRGDFEIKFAVRHGGVVVGVGDGSMMKFDRDGASEQVMPPNSFVDLRPYVR